MTEGKSPALREEHPDHPGWCEWGAAEGTRYNEAVLGLMLARLDDREHARIRVFPREMLTNPHGVIHGGAILGLIDVAMFAGSSILLGERLESGVTVDLSNQFLAPGDPTRPLDAVVEVVRETGRMVFVRGQVVQEDDLIGSFSGILRKIPRK
ncbi:PaaI family thioesterase [Aurantiacibacter zhengii]|uniref:PaaI family thioesterase n=1 Tax=Aurantiacibacter zhengii TaxID=2307003 RepID=A0A418NVU0_9SPHN|nr:PaaI family thioesterase [Aurantiacibacter zhengii]RIV88730.1 PaaI family thioesterase [Aurantiacibacter zhengii]